MTPDTRIGTLLAGKYQVESRIGRGGMGVIYRGTHVRLGTPVAIKVISPDLDIDAEVASRFEREARAAASLAHPNIATIHDLGQLDDGTLYIAMEFIEGPTLKALIVRDGPMATDRVGQLVGQVVSALSVAHKRGIVHRDLKPQNVMVTTGPDGREMAKLLDFGIAKSLDEGATQLTATGLSLGTPQYMAPEQAGGGLVDARSDLYSLGVILYEMLTGVVPFDDPSTPAVLVKHLSAPPPRFAEQRPDLTLPADLEAIALRCLEKEPGRRFQTADELHAAIAAATSAHATVVVHAVGPGAMHAAPGAPGDLDRGDDVVLPPKSALQNLTSVGSGLHMPADAVDERVAEPVGSSVVLALMVLLFVGGVGFAGYTFGYFNSSEPVAAPAPADSAPPPIAASPRPEPTSPVTRREAAPDTLPQAPPAATVASASAPPPGPVAAAPAPGTAAPVPAAVQAPAEPPRPEQPSVRFGCDGPMAVCVALGAEIERELGRASMASEDDEARAEILVDALVVEGARRVEQSFGTTFAITPYTITVSARARRDGARVPMPASRSFSMDERVGQARLVEQARLTAAAVVERVGAFWSAK
ncbi:MAG TPA: serine/threonine-protein kinase [Vicinamibacterales bacterium]|nr:serine/threonine-protein kinase [Vicinamibacterales bacterium]